MATVPASVPGKAARVPRLPWWIAVALAASSALIVVFLSATIYSPNRDWRGYRSFALRGDASIVDWIDQGFFRRAGLMLGYEQVRNRDDAIRLQGPSPTKVYTSQNSVHLIVPLVIQRLRLLLGVEAAPLDQPHLRPERAWSTRYSVGATHRYYAVVAALAGLLLGVLSWQLAVGLGARPFPALLLAVSSQAMYMTGPSQLLGLWELNSTPFAQLFLVALLCLDQAVLSGLAPERTHRLQLAMGFMLGWTDVRLAVFMLGSYLLARAVLTGAGRTLRATWPQLVAIPAGGMVFVAQLALGRWLFPEAERSGSGFLFRSGLDGATEFLQDHRDLWTNVQWTMLPMSRTLIVSAGVAILGMLVAFLFRPARLRASVIVVTGWAAGFMLFAFVFPQAVVIHRYELERFLVPPLVLALFTVVPAALERATRRRGIFVLLAVWTAACWSFAQLRLFAVALKASSQ
jgi:hypothetical protein